MVVEVVGLVRVWVAKGFCVLEVMMNVVMVGWWQWWVVSGRCSGVVRVAGGS